MKIIPEWREAWRFTSVQALLLLQFLPELISSFIDYAPETMDLTIYRVALAIALIARFIYQPKAREATASDDNAAATEKQP
ncbi:hypothetical protein [Pseudomonas sp.]|uniref:DUF7940 domain-containing protein n=1 Tax=Pseudomonas sp. TaxID=306 RepID=UPI002583E17A|nr:hypothetical protein [Pseudomonas sp.]